jgi:hypothetical protein
MPESPLVNIPINQPTWAWPTALSEGLGLPPSSLPGIHLKWDTVSSQMVVWVILGFLLILFLVLKMSLHRAKRWFSQQVEGIGLKTENIPQHSFASPQVMRIDPATFNNIPALKKIETMVSEMFVSMKFENQDTVWSLGDIAVEIWKIQKKLEKMKLTWAPDNSLRGMEISIEKINSVLVAQNIKILDYTGQKFNEGMNWIDIVSREKSDSTTFDIIQETLEPGIELCGVLKKRSRVVIFSPL